MSAGKITATVPMNLDDPLIYVRVTFSDNADEYGESADVGVWVENSDSGAVLKERAMAKALAFVGRVLEDVHG